MFKILVSQRQGLVCLVTTVLGNKILWFKAMDKRVFRGWVHGDKNGNFKKECMAPII